MSRKEANSSSKAKRTTAKKHSAVPAAAVAKKATVTKPVSKTISAAVDKTISAIETPTDIASQIALGGAVPSASSVETQAAASAVAVEASPVVDAIGAIEAIEKQEEVTQPLAAEPAPIEPAMATDISSFLSDLSSPLSHVRERAAGELGRSQNPAACEPLIQLLNDSDADVAREAAVALGTLGVAAASAPLSQVLRNADGYHHAVVRAAAASSLGSLHDAGAVESLINAVYDEQAEVSAEATRALGEFSTDDRAIDALIDVVRNHNNYFLSLVRRAAVLALGRSSIERARAELRYVANDMNEDAVIRIDAARLSYSA